MFISSTFALLLYEVAKAFNILPLSFALRVISCVCFENKVTNNIFVSLFVRSVGVAIVLI